MTTLQKATDHWLERSRSAIQQSVGQKLDAGYLSERLSSLLLQRLPPEVSRQMTALLPREVQDNVPTLRACAESGPERSIGYPSFVERAMHALGCFELVISEDQLTDLAIRITNAFLWSVSMSVPMEIKVEMLEALPYDLRSRMDLTTSLAA